MSFTEVIDMSEAMRRFGLKLNESTQYIESLEDELRETKMKLFIAKIAMVGVKRKLSIAIDKFYIDKDAEAFRQNVVHASMAYDSCLTDDQYPQPPHFGVGVFLWAYVIVPNAQPHSMICANANNTII